LIEVLEELPGVPERMLQEKFPADFRAYEQKVRRWL